MDVEYLSFQTYLSGSNGHSGFKVQCRTICQSAPEIGRSEIIAMGDNYNDVEMIKYAGMGVAMGNAPDEIKAVRITSPTRITTMVCRKHWKNSSVLFPPEYNLTPARVELIPELIK